MNIVPKGAPIAPPAQDSSYAKAQTARANAIRAFTGQPAQPVVQNQTQVSAEEMTAIIPPKKASPLAEISQDSNIVDESAQIPEPNVDTKAKEVEDPTLSRQFAQLAKQERSLRLKAQQQDQALKAREAAIKAKEDAFASKDQEYAQKYIQRDFLKNNPLQALAEAEVSYDDLTQQILNSQNPQDPRLMATISKLEAKIASLEKSSEEGRTQQKTTQDQQYQAAIKQIEADVRHLVDNDPEYETVKHTASHKDVVDLIVETYKEDGVILSVEDAAMEVENHILEEAVKLSRLSKVSKRSQQAVSPSPATQTPAATVAQPKVQSAPTMKTLTNAVASTRPLTARERALLAFEGKLK